LVVGIEGLWRGVEVEGRKVFVDNALKIAFR